MRKKLCRGADCLGCAPRTVAGSPKIIRISCCGFRLRVPDSRSGVPTLRSNYSQDTLSEYYQTAPFGLRHARPAAVPRVVLVYFCPAGVSYPETRARFDTTAAATRGPLPPPGYACVFCCAGGSRPLRCM